MANPNISDKISLSAEIVAAYVSHNSVPAAGLADLIHSVHAALTNLGGVAATPKAEPLVPAVSVRKSITPEYLICLDDGKKLKTLKRHLAEFRDDTRPVPDRSGGFLSPIQWSHLHMLPKGRSLLRPWALDSSARTSGSPAGRRRRDGNASLLRPRRAAGTKARLRPTAGRQHVFCSAYCMISHACRGRRRSW